MKIVKLIVCILFGLMFLNAGLNKLFNYMPMPELSEEQKSLFAAFAKISWLMPLVGVIEALGGLLFMIPKYRALGAIVIFPVMVGVLLHNIVIDRGALPIAVVMTLINLWIIFDNWKKYKPMVS